MPHDRPEQVILQQLRDGWGLQESRTRWLATARPEQITPPGDWQVWLILAGRGWGKTRTGAEDVGNYGVTNPGSRIAIVAPTYADGRDTCIEGESGLRSILPKGAEETWNRSLGELILTNGTRYKLFSGEEPERLRGPQHHRAWCDELAAWKYPSTWDQLAFGLRLGRTPQIVATTTPKPTKLIKALATASTTHVTRGSTFDNAANLAPIVLDQLRARYGGTRIGRQELDAEILEDVAGALWTREMIEETRVAVAPAMRRVVVGVDPSGSDGETGDHQGIVVCGLGVDGRGYVLEDASLRGSPEQWGRAVASAYHRHRADRVVAERNYGGAMVEAVLRAADPNLPVTLVTASRGKHVRAEPVAALYEQSRVSHLGAFPELEDQMVQMTPSGFSGPGSPDRLDGHVWAFTDLMLGAQLDGFLQYAIEAGRQWRAAAEAPARTDGVLMEMPIGTTALNGPGDQWSYRPGPDRRFLANPEHLRDLEGAGCKQLETT
jgi:phage terminase large subunit-like protein